jgi:hypothetical protein
MSDVDPGALVPALRAARYLLRTHYVLSIDCDHARHQDRAICACGTWTAPWCASVAAAVDAWVDHVLAVFLLHVPGSAALLSAPEAVTPDRAVEFTKEPNYPQYSPPSSVAGRGPARKETPIPLNDWQERAIKQWAADDRLWTTQDTVEFNLRTFARSILAAASPRGGDTP